MTPNGRHYIQRDILRNLSRKGEQNFADLQPDNLDNGLFGYHLKQLVNDDLVAKRHTSYRLTSAGLKYVSLATRTNINVISWPKVFCLLIIENEKGQFIMHKRNAAPFIGMYTFPGGNVFYDETLDELVERQLIEKVGQPIRLEHRGVVDLIHTAENVTISRCFAHLYYGRTSSNTKASAKDARFMPEWISPLKEPVSAVMADVPDIIDTVKQNQGFTFNTINYEHASLY